MDPRHLAIHHHVARLRAIGLIGRHAPADGLRPGQHTVAIGHRHLDGPRVALVPRRETQGDDEAQLLARHQVAEADLDATRHGRGRERAERLRLHPAGQQQGQRDAARHDGEQFAQLARQQVRDLGRLLDEVEAAAPGVGHPAQQSFVEIGAHAEGGRRDAALPQDRARRARQLVVIRHPRVRQAVGEQQAAPHRVRRQARGGLVAPGQPAPVQVRGAPRLDPAQLLQRVAARLGRRGGGRHHRVHLVVVDDEREAVVGAQGLQGLADRLASQADLGAAHRARPVEDEGHVERLATGLWGCLGDGQRDEQVAHAGAAGAHERTVGAKVEIHRPPG